MPIPIPRLAFLPCLLPQIIQTIQCLLTKGEEPCLVLFKSGPAGEHSAQVLNTGDGMETLAQAVLEFL